MKWCSLEYNDSHYCEYFAYIGNTCNLDTDTNISLYFKFHFCLKSSIPNQGSKVTKSICEICSFPFPSKWSLQKHVKAVHKEVTFPCSQCSGTFLYQSNLRKHEKDVHKSSDKESARVNSDSITKDFDCTICGRRFTNKVGL